MTNSELKAGKVIIDGARIIDFIEPLQGYHETIDGVQVYFDIWEILYLRGDGYIVQIKLKTFWDSSIALSRDFTSGAYKQQKIAMPKNNIISQTDLEHVGVPFINIVQGKDL